MHLSTRHLWLSQKQFILYHRLCVSAQVISERERNICTDGVLVFGWICRADGSRPKQVISYQSSLIIIKFVLKKQQNRTKN